IVAMFCCLCLLPLALSRRAAPVTPSAPRLRPLAAWRLSPTAMLGVIVAALSASAFRMIGPVYGLEKGLDQTGIALFLSAALVGGVSAQIPIGWLADRIDRRRVLMAVSLAAVVACVVLSRAVPADAPTAIYAGAFLFGMTAFPIYSLAATYANDYAPADFVIDLNASLIFYFSVGAIAAPLLAAELIALFGPGAMFDLIALGHLSLIGFALYRATRRPGAQPAAPYAYIPRTSMVLARLFRTKGPEESGPEAGEPPEAVRQGAERPESAPPPRWWGALGSLCALSDGFWWFSGLGAALLGPLGAEQAGEHHGGARDVGVGRRGLGPRPPGRTIEREADERKMPQGNQVEHRAGTEERDELGRQQRRGDGPHREVEDQRGIEVDHEVRRRVVVGVGRGERIDRKGGHAEEKGAGVDRGGRVGGDGAGQHHTGDDGGERDRHQHPAPVDAVREPADGDLRGDPADQCRRQKKRDAGLIQPLLQPIDRADHPKRRGREGGDDHPQHGGGRQPPGGERAQTRRRRCDWGCPARQGKRQQAQTAEHRDD
ncbi:MAG: MFS transporter, partial [Pseudomonadota bacterium]